MNNQADSVSIIDTATNTVISTVTVENYLPIFGKFIGGNIQKAKSNSSKAKASMSKHKQKTTPNTIKQKKSPTVKWIKNSWIPISIKWK